MQNTNDLWLKGNTLRQRQKGRRFADDIFKTTFSWMKIYEFGFKFHWNLFLMVKLIIFQHCFRWWLGANQATSHYLNQWWPRLPMHICITRLQWVNHNGWHLVDKWTTFSNAFSLLKEKLCSLVSISLKSVPQATDNKSALVQVMLW